MNIKAGEIYTIKPGCETKCNNYNKEKYAKKIKVNQINSNGKLDYDILNNNNNKINSCYGCFRPEHLILETKTLYNLAIGDEIELNNYKNTILSVLPSSPENPIYILSLPYNNDTDDDKKQTSAFYTAYGLEQKGYKVSNQPEEVQEMTLEDVSKLVGKKVKIVE